MRTPRFAQPQRLRYDGMNRTLTDRGGAQLAFLQIIAPETTATRKALRITQLLAYCKLDTFAMVRVREALLKG